jgi:hypothetical protein
MNQLVREVREIPKNSREIVLGRAALALTAAVAVALLIWLSGS